MRYVLMLCSDVSDETVAGKDPDLVGCGGWTEEMDSRGILRVAEGLRPSSDATTLRVRGDRVLLTDGPFAETKDQIGGFSVIECADLDEAIELASAHPWARAGQIEIRPVWEP